VHFRDSVRAKLISVVMIVAMVAALLGGLGLTKMDSINDRLKKIVDQTSEGQVLATNIRVELMGLHRAEKNLLLADTPAEFEEFAGNIKERKAAIDELAAKLNPLCTEKELLLLSSFRDAFVEFKEVSKEVTELARLATDRRAAELSAGHGRDLFDQAIALIENMNNTNEKRALDMLSSISGSSESDEQSLVIEAVHANDVARITADIVSDLVRLQRAEKNAILADEPHEMALYKESSQTIRTEIRDGYETLRDMLDGDDVAKLEEFSEAFDRWLVVNTEVLELSEKSTNSRAANLSAGSGRDVFEMAASRMEELALSKDKAMIDDKEEAGAAFAQARSSIIVTGVIGVLFAVVLAVVMVSKLVQTLSAVVAKMLQIADGDLAGDPVPVKSRDEIGKLAEASNQMQDNLSGMIEQIAGTSDQVAAASTQLAASSQQMVLANERQQSQLSQSASAIEQMSASIKGVSCTTNEVSSQSKSAGEDAAAGGQIVNDTVEEIKLIADQVRSTSTAVGQLSGSAVKIGDILTVINEIAEQTNLLALNAAIEAARAGEHGRGFAVVADEVRKLAERTQHATKEVSDSVAEIQQSTDEATQFMEISQSRVANGVDLANEAGSSLERIVDGASQVSKSFDAIAAAVGEQSAASSEIASTIESVSDFANEATEGARQASDAAMQLSENAEQLRSIVSRFSV